MSLVHIARSLARAVSKQTFGPPVTHVYNPLVHARRPAELYLTRYAHEGVPTLLLGMNPGPFGMVQTGVPFGEVEFVRGWLGIEGPVSRPEREHAKRPVEGFACKRSEKSGARLWGFARERFGSPERFFESFFVWNYCPLAFVEESGRNRTPDELPAAEREPLFAACDAALVAAVSHLRPKLVVGVGRFAEKRARIALAELVTGSGLAIGGMLHPSPASPAANSGWAKHAEAQLVRLGALT